MPKCDPSVNLIRLIIQEKTVTKIFNKTLVSHVTGHEQMCLMPYANNKGADQPAHPRSLISAFVIRCQDRTIPLVSISKISRFYLVSVAEQISLCLAWSETPEDTFSHGVAQMKRPRWRRCSVIRTVSVYHASNSNTRI